MVRNGRKYGIMTTINGFIFLCRENHGKLFITRMAPASVPVPTILKMLYYMSYLAAAAEPLPETDGYGQTLAIPAANYNTLSLRLESRAHLLHRYPIKGKPHIAENMLVPHVNMFLRHPMIRIFNSWLSLGYDRIALGRELSKAVCSLMGTL